MADKPGGRKQTLRRAFPTSDPARCDDRREPNPIGLGPARFTPAIDQVRRPPIAKGGSPPKKRHMRSLPPFALHLQYAPKSGSDWKPSCGITPPPPSGGNPP